jgi:UTP--glucose-1-phosphate uridylyltransferase/phosphoglucomutase
MEGEYDRPGNNAWAYLSSLLLTRSSEWREASPGTTLFCALSFFLPVLGLEKAKSLLVVKDGKTFIDLIAEQVRVMAR